MTLQKVDGGMVSDLRRRVRGGVSDTADELEAYSSDYGGIVHRRPGAVVRPLDDEDVARTVAYAFERSIPVSTRAMGHSLSGQSLNDGGILLDLRSLATLEPVSPSATCFTAQPGVLWRDVVAAATPHSLSPPVLTGYPHVSVGGTLSAGGWGMSSARHGAQIDNCVWLDVVTGEGERVRCSRDEHADLFHHVLGGMGQFGVITRVGHRLRRHAPWLRTYILHYEHLTPYLEDNRTVALNLLGEYVECSMPQLSSEGRRARFGFELRVSLEMESPGDQDDARVLSLLRPDRIEITDRSTADFISLAASVETKRPPGIAHPWMVTFLPWKQLEAYIEACMEGIPPSALGGKNGPLHLWAAPKSASSMPMLRTPDDEAIALFGIFPTASTAIVEVYKTLMSRASDLALSKGGKRHLATWVHFDLPRWRLHFGDYWPVVNEMKRRFDPGRILNPGFVEYEADG